MTPEGSEALPCGPWNHSKVGEGTLAGRGVGEIRVAEHLSEKLFPAMFGPEGERIIGSNCTVGNNKSKEM